MRRLSFVILLMLLVASAAFIVSTSGQLPERVASHFGSGGDANGWMTREFYTWFMLAFGVLLPAVIVAVITLLPRIAARSVDLSSRERREPIVRRDAAIAAIAGHAPWLGAIVCAFVAGIHYAILDAHATVPPRLSGDLFLALVAVFVVAIAAWIVALRARTRDAG